MRRIAPAAALSVVAAIGFIIALLVSAPPGVTQRYDSRPAGPVELRAGVRCFDLSVLPDDTRYVRLQAEPGERVPTSVSVLATGVAPIASSGPVRRGDPKFVEYKLTRPTEGDHLGAKFCATVPKGGVTLLGETEKPAITLLGDPHGSWLSALPTLIERAAYGRGTVIGWAALPLALLLLVAAWIVAVREASTSMRDPAPVGRRTIVRVGVVATLFCAAFAFTTPTFQAPDEMAHLGYVELLAQEHKLPTSVEQRGDLTSPQGQLAVGVTGVGLVAFAPDRRPPWTGVQDEALDDALKRLPSGGAVDSFTNSSSQPPAYYAVVAVVESITGGSILDRLLVARLLSALLFGLAVAGAVAFAREAAPRAGGLAVAGGVLLATLPILAFIGGSINPDALLTAVAAWTFVVLARILRSGPTVRLGLALGALVGLGLLTKLIFIGLLPAVALAAVVVLVRAARSGELRTAVLSVGAALIPVAAVALPYFAWAILSDRGISFGPAGPPGPVLTLRETLTYGIELYVGQFGPLLDRIPGSGPWDIWLSGLTGRLGWVDYGMPVVVVRLLAVFWGLLLVGAIVGVVRSAFARRSIPMDAVVYAVAVAGLLLLIARSGLTARAAGALGFEQARYLFPVAAIGVAGVAHALRQLPRPALRDWAAAIVVVIGLIDGTAAFLLTVGRYFA